MIGAIPLNNLLQHFSQTSLLLGSVLLRGLGVMSDDVRFLRRMMRESMELRAQETVDRKESKEIDWLVTFQVCPLWFPQSRIHGLKMTNFIDYFMINVFSDGVEIVFHQSQWRIMHVLVNNKI